MLILGLLIAEIYPDSLNLLMILCIVDGEIHKFFATVHWEMLLLNFRLFARAVFTKVVNLTPTLLVNSFEDAPFKPNHDSITCLPVERSTQILGELLCNVSGQFLCHSDFEVW